MKMIENVGPWSWYTIKQGRIYYTLECHSAEQGTRTDFKYKTKRTGELDDLFDSPDGDYNPYTSNKSILLEEIMKKGKCIKKGFRVQ